MKGLQPATIRSLAGADGPSRERSTRTSVATFSSTPSFAASSPRSSTRATLPGTAGLASCRDTGNGFIRHFTKGLARSPAGGLEASARMSPDACASTYRLDTDIFLPADAGALEVSRGRTASTGFDPKSLYPGARGHPRAIQIARSSRANDALGSLGISWDTLMQHVSPDRAQCVCRKCHGGAARTRKATAACSHPRYRRPATHLAAGTHGSGRRCRRISVQCLRPGDVGPDGRPHGVACAHLPVQPATRQCSTSRRPVAHRHW